MQCYHFQIQLSYSKLIFAYCLNMNEQSPIYIYDKWSVCWGRTPSPVAGQEIQSATYSIACLCRTSNLEVTFVKNFLKTFKLQRYDVSQVLT